MSKPSNSNLHRIHYFICFSLFFFFRINSFCQIPVVVSGFSGTTPTLSSAYPSLNEALIALNGLTSMAGPVTLTLASGNSEKAPNAKGFTLGSASLNPLLNGSNTITIIKSGSGAVNLYAASGSTSLTSAPYEPDGIFKLVGADHVTIDGLTFRDTNTLTSFSRMEFGVGLFKRSAVDGCNNNIIRNCNFFMSRANNGSFTNTILPDGATAILAVNAVSNDVQFQLNVSNGGTISTNGTNSGNKLYGNYIEGGNNGIAFVGYPATIGVGPRPDPLNFLGDLNNEIGGSDSALGNRIFNFGGGGVNPSSGIRVRNGWTCRVSFNRIDNNDGAGLNHAGVLHGIYMEAGPSANVIVVSNSISLKSNATSDPLYGIRNNIGNIAASNKVSVSGNNIKGCTYNNQTTGSFYAISNSAICDTLEISANIVSDISLTSSVATSGSTFFIHNTARQTGLLEISKNEIKDITNISTRSGVHCIYNGGATENIMVTQNIIRNIRRVNTSTGSLYGFNNQVAPAGGKLSFFDNNISQLSPGGIASSLRAFNLIGSAAQVVELKGNIFENIDLSGVASASSSAIIYLPTANVSSIHGNIIRTVNNNSSNLNLIYVSGAATSCEIFSNQFSEISTQVSMVLFDFRGINARIYKNKIFNIINNSFFGQLTGFSFSNTSTTTPVSIKLNNNLIGHFSAPSSSALEAISIFSFDRGFSGSLAEINYNTVYLNASSNGSSFGASLIKSFNNSNGIALDLRNNLFINTSTPVGINGYSAVIRCPVATFGNYYYSTSNNNFLYGGPPSSARVLFYDGSNSFQDLSQYKSFFNPREINSVTDTSFGSPVFNSLTFFESLNGNDHNYLKPRACGLSLLNGAQPLPGLSDDYSGVARSSVTPDIGAWEVNNSGLIVPIFDSIAPVCKNQVIPALPSVSNNGINGNWSPALNTTQTTRYTFVPDAGQCSDTATLTIVVRPILLPDFNPVAPICAGQNLSALPSISSNGITGSWSPAPDNSQTTVYTFIPYVGQCADSVKLTIVVNPIVIPEFDSVSPVCEGQAIAALPTISKNGIKGSWTPSINNNQTTTYDFTPDSGQCALPVSLTIRVNPSVTPIFDSVASICTGQFLAALPTTSKNGISGTWSPALNNTRTTTYTFSPATSGCINSVKLTIAVKPCSFEVFPNPNNGEFSISIPENSASGKTLLQIFDAKAAKVFEGRYDSGLGLVKSKYLASGIYLVVFRDASGKILFKQKMIVSH